ncbi:MAG: dTDP-4-dehydrorhamnose reductase [Deltaproteobacteria bacterium]|nr:dTDP-4-dehydrorhamnose reductase [Deltaproteobacteria bacterium]
MTDTNERAVEAPGQVKRRMLITGGSGLLGKEIFGVFEGDYDVHATDVKDCDVSNPVDCRRVMREFRPMTVVHCAAYTAVDRAETEEKRAFAVNAGGTRNIARQCREQGALLVAYGSDYIFDGKSRRPYAEDDEANPLSAYGRTKWEAEKALREEAPDHLLVRSQWLYGPHGRNFVFAVLEKARRGETLRVANDQTGCPTFARDLAEATRRLIDAGARGTFHFSNEGETTWYGFARFIFAHACSGPVSVAPAVASELPYPAPRPAYSVLDKRKYRDATGAFPRRWDDAVLEFIKKTCEKGVAW